MYIQRTCFSKIVYNFVYLKYTIFQRSQFYIFNVHTFSKNTHNSIHSVYSKYTNFQRLYIILYTIFQFFRFNRHIFSMTYMKKIIVGTRLFNDPRMTLGSYVKSPNNIICRVWAWKAGPWVLVSGLVVVFMEAYMRVDLAWLAKPSVGAACRV